MIVIVARFIHSCIITTASQFQIGHLIVEIHQLACNLLKELISLCLYKTITEGPATSCSHGTKLGFDTKLMHDKRNANFSIWQK